LGTAVTVFVYRDGSGALAITTHMPKLYLGEVTFLTVTAVTDIGGFVDWGLGKELLVPFAEQTTDLAVGDRHAFGLYLDKTGRLAATMRVRDLFAAPSGFSLDEWVEGEAWRDEPAIGLFVILERTYVGLVPASEPHILARGQTATFRIAHVLPDGKVVLSLRGHAHHELEHDAAAILAVVSKRGAAPVGDRLPPDEIRARFGLSKKAFKRAVGRLLRDRVVTVDGDGWLLVTASAAPASSRTGE
jgi:uncharacterized protein